MTTTDDPLLVLHKYFLAANIMYSHFNEELKKLDATSSVEINPDLINTMTIWYGCLHVVIEGWNTLSLKDSVIDNLLSGDFKDLLRGCRNDTFHFQKCYYPQRTIELFSKQSFAKWAREIHSEFGRYFLEQFKLRRINKQV